MFRGCSGVFRGVPGMFRGCSGVFQGCSGVFRAVPGFTDTRNYRESGVSREISNFFIFCPSNLYSEVFSKITLKVSTAFYFFRNRAKFENKAYRPLSNSEIGGKLHIFISLVR